MERMTLPAGPAALLAPEWLAHRYDPGRDAVHLVRAGRALRRQVPSLIDKHLPGAAEPRVVPRRDLRAVTPPSVPVHFVFHSAYCPSTLLATALDVPGVATSYKEPQLLDDLVGWRHRGGPPAQVGAMLDQALTLLARPFETGEACVIMPSDVVNGLAEGMLKLRPEARCILLHAPLQAFVTSIARDGVEGRLRVRDLLSKQLTDGLVAGLGFEKRDHLLHTDLQAAAVGWLAQQRLFAKLAELWPKRVRTLDSEVLLRRPAEVLAAAGLLFGRGMSEEQIAAVAEQFARSAENDAASPSGAQSNDRAAPHADEIGKVVAWATAVADNAGAQINLPAALVAI